VFGPAVLLHLYSITSPLAASARPHENMRNILSQAFLPSIARRAAVGYTVAMPGVNSPPPTTDEYFAGFVGYFITDTSAVAASAPSTIALRVYYFQRVFSMVYFSFQDIANRSLI
jgi:hypothetical protein